MAPAARPNARPGPMPRPRASAGAGAAIAVTPTAATVARTANVFFMILSFVSGETTHPICDGCARGGTEGRQKIRWSGERKRAGRIVVASAEPPLSGRGDSTKAPSVSSAMLAGFLSLEGANGSRHQLLPTGRRREEE